MRVLVLGATGTIGYPVALAYVRAGHQVFGTTRSEGKAKSLLQEEITPIIVTSSTTSWSTHLSSIDVLVDCSITISADTCLATIKAAADAAKDRAEFSKLTYIFTSGTWTYGSSEILRDERCAESTGTGLTAWRSHVEQTVLSHKALNGIVVRPGIVYGRAGSLTALLFERATKASDSEEAGDMQRTFEWPATPGHRWGLIHQDDLADLILRVGESSPILAHLAFDAVHPASESVEDILSTLDQLLSVKHAYITPEEGSLYEGMDTQVWSKPSLGRALVGWEPKKASFVSGMQTYYAAWKAGL